MYLTSFLEEGTLTIFLAGEIDHHCAKDYISAISAKIETYFPKKCILDFQEVSFMDSSGIAIVINSLRFMNKTEGMLELIGLQSQPMKVLRASGIEKLVKIQEVIK